MSQRRSRSQASEQAQEQFGPFADRWLVAIRSSRSAAASPRFVPRSLPGLHSIALEAGATTHQVASAPCHASLAPTAMPNGSQSKAMPLRTFCLDRAPTRQLSELMPDYPRTSAESCSA